ncbi:MAG: 3-deoxy-7-phosphoheptulonate synthase [Clostridia bacterium]|nr:3-deoxy-7-phosphoheptulonate synthase [Clostridia bacterium]
MVVIIKKNQEKQSLQALLDFIQNQGLQTAFTQGDNATLISVLGDTSKLDVDRLRSFPVVESVKKIGEPYKLASKKFHSQNTVVCVGDKKIGEDFCFIAGPCSIESERQMLEIAHAVKKAGADFLRGGAFKPRTSPYAFQGLQKEGLSYLLKAKQETGLPVVSEIVSAEHLDLFSEVDILQIGARNMQNFELLKAVGQTQKPVLLKRGLSATVEEWLLSAEYLLAEGNPNVILCERGIRTFETSARATLDITSLPVLKKLTHLPVIVDPSHAAGEQSFVEPLALASVGAGASGLMIETHNDPCSALCDGQQAVSLQGFEKIVQKSNAVLSALNGK